MQRLCRRLNSGDNLYLMAPCRSGKTSIMYRLIEKPCAGYTFIYVNTEPLNDTEQYFRKLLEEVLRSKAVSGLVKHKNRLAELRDDLLTRIKKIGPIELNPHPSEKPSEIFLELITKIDPTDLKLVIMVDEFPSTVANIAKKSGNDAAIAFLQLNRSIRQNPSRKVQTIYTGSIGLPALVSQLNASSAVNDLSNFEIPPFDRTEATELCGKLFANENIYLSTELNDRLLDRIGWLMPFFVQLAISQVIDIYYYKDRQQITAEDIDQAVTEAAGLRNNNHFESYFQRISSAFSKEEADFAYLLLKSIAHEGQVKVSDISALAPNTDAGRLRYVITSLELDGYISRVQDDLRFHSPILQGWWQNYAY